MVNEKPIRWDIIICIIVIPCFIFAIVPTQDTRVQYVDADPIPTYTPVSTPTQNLGGCFNIYKSTPIYTPIPDDYYNSDFVLPEDMTVKEFLNSAEWTQDYEADSWDCSQMSAFMEFALENLGYHTVIRTARKADGDRGHAWILVEFKEGWLAYECTGRYWVYPSEDVARSYDPYGYVHWNPSMYDAGVQYESIYDVWEYYQQYSNGEEEFEQEWAWWIK